MKNKIYLVAFVSIMANLLTACHDYLDIVPDKTQEVDLLFDRKESAYIALSTCYHYLPMNDGVYSTYAFASDELTTPIAQETPGIELMRGKQSTNDPIMGFWSGYYAHGKSQESLWKGIRDCNTLIENIDRVLDMSDKEKQAWKAEGQFLKAYYHFLLVSQYGPIPILDENTPISAGTEAVRVKRQPVDACFTYIVNTIDNAIPHLPLYQSSNNQLGRIDQMIAAAIKAKVLLYAASPLFNGNAEFYDNFVDKDGEHLFNLQYDAEKWKLAADASKVAIDMALAAGKQLYQYNEQPAAFDSTNYDSTSIQALYNYRYMFTSKWNNELIWGNSDPVRNGTWWALQAAAMMINPDASSAAAAWQWVSPTLRMAELYYTKNGLPIDEDLSFNYNSRFGLRPVPASESLNAQQGELTVNLHLGREPRFYASIGFDQGFNRTWGELWELDLKKGEAHGRKANTNDYVITGYVLKKICHPASEGDDYAKLVNYPWPIIRLAELYLMYAEASNEYAGPSQEIYNALNEIRSRSGVPNVEVAWSDALLAKTPNKHTNKEGLREIIQQERMIELAFEGHRYYDIRRWKKGAEYFSTPVKGWSVDESDVNAFYTIKDVGNRSFITPRDYLQPIKQDELIINSNLVQNPGW